MVKKSSLKIGFTLVEALTSMLIISIFFAVMSKTIISKPKTAKKPEYHHGFYECYNPRGYVGDNGRYQSGATLIQRYHLNGISNGVEMVQDNANCTFKPVKGTAYAVIYAFTGEPFIVRTNHNTQFFTESELRQIRVFSKVLPQFTADEITIPRTALGRVPSEYLDMDMEEADLNYNDFLNIVNRNYSDSILSGGNALNWRGPGIFICW